MEKIDVIILAAGKGTRMGENSTPKILMKLNDISILELITSTLKKIKKIEKIQFVLGYKWDMITKALENLGIKYEYTIQDQLNGTAKSLEIGLRKFKPTSNTLLVLFGDDAGLYRPKTIATFINHHIYQGNKCTMMILNEKRSLDIGALKLNKNNEIVGVIPKSKLKDGNKYVLCGAFCFDRIWITKNIGKIRPSERSGEYPLPQIIDVAISKNIPINSFELKNSNEWESINDLSGLKLAEIKLKLKK